MSKEKIKRNLGDPSRSIVTMNPTSMQSFRFQRNEIQVNNLNRSSNSGDFFVSYISAKDTVTGTLEISRNISDDDLQDMLEVKAYEELGLDTSISYKINFLEIDSSNGDDKSRIFSAFAINSILMVDTFLPLQKKVKYIDYITTAPFLVGALYDKNILERNGNECFIYFQKHDAFLAIYKDGKYLYSKSLAYSLTEINEKFCSLTGERIDENEFYKLLSTDGLRSLNPDYQQQFMKLFGEIFLYINDIAIFARRTSGISQIDRVYIGTEVGIVNGMLDYAKSTMGIESHNFNFNVAINSKDWYVDQIHLLMMLTAQIYLESPDNNDSLNFTVFKRPPPLLERPSGKLLAVVAATLAIALVYPLVQYSIGTYKLIQHNTKSKVLEELVVEAKTIEDKIVLLKKDLGNVESDLDREVKILSTRESLLQEIYKKRVDYTMKSTVFYDLTLLVNKRSLKLEKLSYSNDIATLSVVGSDEKKITELLDEIANTNKYSVRTKEIMKDENGTLYRSDINVEAL